MKDYIAGFSDYLAQVKRVSANTLDSYLRDTSDYLHFLQTQNMASPVQADVAAVQRYTDALRDSQKSNATITRHVASVRCFYQYLMLSGEAMENPARSIKVDKPAKKMPQILSGEEIDQLLSQPDPRTPKGCRDKAMLEVLYATGIRASELCHLDVEDVNLHTGLLRCRGERGERVIPMYPEAVAAVSDYVFRVRRMLVVPETGQALFTNLNGRRLTRQGFWKIVKRNAEEAHILKEITPHTLRHSFALHLLENGADIKDIQQMMGHADIASTQVYMRMLNDHVTEVYNQYHPRAKLG